MQFPTETKKVAKADLTTDKLNEYVQTGVFTDASQALKHYGLTLADYAALPSNEEALSKRKAALAKTPGKKFEAKLNELGFKYGIQATRAQLEDGTKLLGEFYGKDKKGKDKLVTAVGFKPISEEDFRSLRSKYSAWAKTMRVPNLSNQATAMFAEWEIFRVERTTTHEGKGVAKTYSLKQGGIYDHIAEKIKAAKQKGRTFSFHLMGHNWSYAGKTNKVYHQSAAGRTEGIPAGLTFAEKRQLVALKA